MRVKEKAIVLAHEPDAAWIIALWKAIHGGDPPPQEIAAGVIASMAPYLREFGEPFTAKQLESGFQTLGVQVTQGEHEAANQEHDAIRPPRQYCFKFQGKTICITLPTVKVPPPEE
jgi:hypothetical protein